MKNNIVAEFKKLTTIRSTYALSSLALIIVAIISFYGNGFKSGAYDSNYLLNSTRITGEGIALFVAIIAVLMMAHEYRYNTILYTITLSKNKSAILASKIATILALSIVLTTIAFLLTAGLSLAGAAVAGHALPDQVFNLFAQLGKTLFYSSGFALAGLLITALVRNITASLAVLFILPNTIEQLLSLILKENVAYLPFHALARIGSSIGADKISVAGAMLVYTTYMIIGWVIAWKLFLKRDAN